MCFLFALLLEARFTGSESIQGCHDVRLTLDIASVIAGETKKTMKFFAIGWYFPVFDLENFVWIGRNTLCRDNMA